MDKIFLLPICFVIIGILYQIFKSGPWIAPGLISLTVALFPAVIWAIRNLGPFYSGADIGAGLILIGSSVLLLPIVAIVFFKTRDWTNSKALKYAGLILGIHLSISGANHFKLVNQHIAYMQKSIQDCKVMPYHCAVRDGKKVTFALEAVGSVSGNIQQTIIIKGFFRNSALVSGETLEILADDILSQNPVGFTAINLSKFPNGPIGASSPIHLIYLDENLKIGTSPNAFTGASELFIVERIGSVN